MNLSRIGGRLFLLCLAVLASLVWLKSGGKLADGPFVTSLLGTIGAYITDGAHQRHVDAAKP